MNSGSTIRPATNPPAEEDDFVAAAAAGYTDTHSPWEIAVRRAAIRVIAPHLPRHAAILELGCGGGYMTALLAPLASRHVVVDGAPEFIEEAKSRVPNTVQFQTALFEEFEPVERFDLVVMSFILEHIADPVALVARARTWLKPDTGRIFAIVPNMRVLSRQLGRVIGVVSELAELTKADLIHGHRRSYDRVSFDREFERSDSSILQRGGLMLKPFANMHMDKILQQGIIGDEQLRGLELLGHEYPDLCTAIYIVAR